MAGRPPRLLAISDRRGLGTTGFDAWLELLRAAGVDGVQVREKDLGDRELLALARRARARLERPTAVLVNGRIDVALAAGCDGVHLPAAELPVAALRRRFGSEMLIGRSTHRPEEVAAARRDGADYVTFGPIRETPSKRAWGPPPGFAGLRRAVAEGLPVLALGGLAPEDVPAVAAAGAWGVAGIGAFRSAESLAAMVAASTRAWPGDGR